MAESFTWDVFMRMVDQLLNNRTGDLDLVIPSVYVGIQALTACMHNVSCKEAFLINGSGFNPVSIRFSKTCEMCVQGNFRTTCG